MTSITNALLTHISGWLPLKDVANAARVCKTWNQTMSPEKALSQRGTVPVFRTFTDEDSRVKCLRVLGKIKDKVLKASLTASMLCTLDNKLPLLFPKLTHLEVSYCLFLQTMFAVDCLPHLKSLSLTNIYPDSDYDIFNNKTFLKRSLSLEIVINGGTVNFNPEFMKSLNACASVTALSVLRDPFSDKYDGLVDSFAKDLDTPPNVTKLCLRNFNDNVMASFGVKYFRKARPITQLHTSDMHPYFNLIKRSIGNTLTYLSLDSVASFNRSFIQEIVSLPCLRVVLLQCNACFNTKSLLDGIDVSCTKLETLSIVSSNADEPITEWPSAKAIYEFIQGFPMLSHLDTDASVWESLMGARKEYPQSERLRLTQRHPFPSIMDL